MLAWITARTLEKVFEEKAILPRVHAILLPTCYAAVYLGVKPAVRATLRRQVTDRRDIGQVA
jgi:hypothetical protein